MGFFKPQNARQLAEFFTTVCKKWDSMSDEKKASGEYINPDEPVVLRCENPEFDDMNDEDDSESHLHFHVKSIGGGYDEDEDGEECGHDGAQIGGMEIGEGFFYNGRRHSK